MKRLSDTLGVLPTYASQLDTCGVRTLLDLADVRDPEELSARSGVPLDWLQQWNSFAKQEVTALRHRRRTAIALNVVALGLLAVALSWWYARVRQLRLANAQLEVGNYLYDRREYVNSAAAYQKALGIKPDYAEAQNNLGTAFAMAAVGLLSDKRTEYLAQAIAAYNEALRLKPDFPEALNNRGSALEDIGRCDDAVQSYRNAVALKPDFAGALNNLGLALTSDNDLDQGIGYLRRAIAAKPDLAEAHSNLGFALNKRGQYPDAIAELQKAIDLKPDYPEALNNLGFALNQTGEYDKSIPVLQKAIDLRPDYYSPYRHLGDAFAAKGKLDSAITSYLRAIELKPDYPRADYNLAIALMQKGESEAASGNSTGARHYAREAIHYFGEAQRLDPTLKPPECKCLENLLGTDHRY